jgi:hypothetical protein
MPSCQQFLESVRGSVSIFLFTLKRGQFSDLTCVIQLARNAKAKFVFSNPETLIFAACLEEKLRTQVATKNLMHKAG